VAVTGIYTSGCTGAAPMAACSPSPICDGKTSTPPAAASAGAAKLPCDIFAEDGGPCVAAHSTVRALYASYTGPLYQLRKTVDGMLHDVHPVAAGGRADGADQDTFCGTDACTIATIYDQSGHGNDLTKAPAGMAKTTPDNEANAK